MNKFSLMASVLSVLGLLASGAAAQEIETDNGTRIFVTPNVSTLGVGIDAGIRANPYFGIRGVHNQFDIDGTHTYEDSDFSYEGVLKSSGIMLDIHPFGGNLRMSGGVRKNGNSASLETSKEGSFDYNGQSYVYPTATRINGNISFPDLAPVLSVGYHGNLGKHVSIGADVGVMYHGTPKLDLAASGGIADDILLGSDFRDEVEAQRRDIQSDLEDFKFTPVAKVGLTIRF